MAIIVALPALLYAPVAADTGLSLSDAITLSLDYNYGVKSARYDSAAAAFNYMKAKTLRFPTLSLEARSNFIDEVPSLELPFMNIEIGSKENYQADFRLSMPLYTGGRLSNGINIERENSRAEAAKLRAEELLTAYDCRRIYLQLMMAQSSVNIAGASLERVKIIEQDVRNLYDNGLADSIDVLEAALAVEKGRQVLNRQETVHKIAMASLYRITGLDRAGPIHPTENIQAPREPDFLSQQEPPEIKRAELERLRHLARAADFAASLSQAEYFPALGGFAGYSAGKPNLDMFNKNWNDYFTIGLTLNWEFNLGGKTGKSRAAARRRALSARMAEKELLDGLLLRYETAASNLEHAYCVIQISGREYDLAGRRFNLASQKQKAGRLSVNRLLEMEAELTATEQQYRASIIQYYLAEADYLYALGSPEIFGGL